MSDMPAPRDQFWPQLIPYRKHSVPTEVAVGVLCLRVGLAVRLTLTQWIAGVPFITFFPLIVVASVWGGAWAGCIVVFAGAGFAFSGITTGTSWPGLTVTLILFSVSGVMMIVIIHALQSAMAQLRASEEEAEVVAREMRHRVANVLQLVQSISQLTWRSTPDPAQAHSLFESRLAALSKSHRLSSSGNGLPRSLDLLLRELLAAYDLERIYVSGRNFELSEDTAPRLGFIIHELATNAAKHGALSVPEGQVTITWRELPKLIEIVWVEKGGPAVTPPARQGFGSKLIPAALPPALGNAEVTYPPEGVMAVIRLLR